MTRIHPDISIVVPAFNEEESVLLLWEEVVGLEFLKTRSFEVIFVDDGSTDGTRAQVQGIASSDPRARLVSFPVNRGKSAAYSAGFDAARGEVVVTMDADLQDSPPEMEKLVTPVENDECDIAIGWKQQRIQNEPRKAFPSRVFNRLVSAIFGVRLHDVNCGYRAMRIEVAQSLDLRGDLYRFIPFLAHAQGYRLRETPVQHRKRKFGISKYGATRFWTGLLDVLTLRFLSRYRDRPLHFLGTVGLLPLIGGAALYFYVLTMRYALDSTFRTHTAALIAGTVLIIAGVQCILTGLVAELIRAQPASRPAREIAPERERVHEG